MNLAFKKEVWARDRERVWEGETAFGANSTQAAFRTPRRNEIMREGV